MRPTYIKSCAAAVLGLVAGVLVFASNSHAKRSELLDNALRQSLSEREEVHRSFGRHSEIERPVESRRDGAARIGVEIGGELGGGSSRLASFDRSEAPRHDEGDVEAKMAEEIEAVNQEMRKPRPAKK